MKIADLDSTLPLTKFSHYAIKDFGIINDAFEISASEVVSLPRSSQATARPVMSPS